MKNELIAVANELSNIQMPFVPQSKQEQRYNDKKHNNKISILMNKLINVHLNSICMNYIK